jgi:large subunit ribosomal protein L25
MGLRETRVEEPQEDAAWWRKTFVEWTGIVPARDVPGADIGVGLYAGKKRMFKGHKWERMRERRVVRTNILLRDMDKRVQRFKRVRGTRTHRQVPFVLTFLSCLPLLFLV